jgi:hypothetical protein
MENFPLMTLFEYIKENTMKKWITSLFAVTLISGCSTIPSTPKPHPEKYTFQVIGIEVPEGTLESSKMDIEKIIQHPDAEISEYPIVLAGLGESVTNDQTKCVLMPEDYDIVDGELVAKEKIVMLGYSTSVTVDKIENGAVSYHLNASYNELVGFDEYKTEGGVAKMPFFNKRAVDTDLTQKPNSWTMMGGLIDKRSDGKKVNRIICVRAISPNVIQ